jgi:hypothetical protein
MENKLFAIILAMLFFLGTGCSSGGPGQILPDENYPIETQDLDPGSPMPFAFDGYSAMGLLGAYELTISWDDATAELTPIRKSAIGESWIINGLTYFNYSPCINCLEISGVTMLENGNLVIVYDIVHPFELGNPANPITGRNRWDLDIFDVALVIEPKSAIPTEFTSIGADVYDDEILDASGYTSELSYLLDDPDNPPGSTYDYPILPYVIVNEDENNNRFAMGQEEAFIVTYNEHTGDRFYKLYLTFGYGASAVYSTRFCPKYYIPEFNRKNAWKVEVVPPEGQNSPAFGNTWDQFDFNTGYTVTVKVWDWQQDATVWDNDPPPEYSGLPPENPPYDCTGGPEKLKVEKIYAASEVEKVWLEIPAIFNNKLEETESTDGDGSFNDPLIYEFSGIKNDNHAIAGEYLGLVKVIDERDPQDPPSADRDYLINSILGGKELVDWKLPEYATYQVFKATVVKDQGCVISIGGLYTDIGNSIATDDVGNIYITGSFQSLVDFDPSSSYFYLTSTGGSDIFLAKYDPNCDLQWAKKWGSTEHDIGYDVGTYGSGSNKVVYVTGYYGGTTDFDPGLSTDSKATQGRLDAFLSKFECDGDYIWSRTWGGSFDDSGYGLVTDSSGNVYVTGYFNDEVDFDPDANDTALGTSSGGKDIFVTKFDSSGDYQGPSNPCIWGGEYDDEGHEVTFWDDTTSYIYVSGFFMDEEVDFDTDPGSRDPFDSNGNEDAFLSKFDTSLDYVNSDSWPIIIGTSGTDIGWGTTTDSESGIYITGDYNGSGFINKYEPDSDLLWNKSINETSAHSYDIDVSDSSMDYQSVVSVGSWQGTKKNFYVRKDPFDGSIPTTLPDDDYWRRDFNSHYGRRLGGELIDWSDDRVAYGIATGKHLLTGDKINIYLTGYYKGKIGFNFDNVRDTEWQRTSAGDADIFILKLFKNGRLTEN